MAENDQIPAYLDTFPDLLRGRARGAIAQSIIESMHRRIDEQRQQLIDRYSKIPQTFVLQGPHLPLLLEAQQLWVEAHFYSCVAMCGITAERILLDLFKKTLAASVADKLPTVSDAARRALEKAGAKAITHFLVHVGALKKEAFKPLQELAALRNKYAHAAGSNEMTDALRAIQLLHCLIEATVSVFNDREANGGLTSLEIVAVTSEDDVKRLSEAESSTT